MSLLSDICVALRVSSDAMDSEVQMLIDAALYDMERAGVNPALLEVEDGELASGNAYVMHAVTAYCKGHFGYDNDEALRFIDSYNRVVVDLLNSSQNVAAIAAEELEDGGDGGE